MSKIISLDGTDSNANKLSLNILTQPTIKCADCGDMIFDSVMVLKKINKMLIGAPQDQVVPISIFRCLSCGTLSNAGLPDPSVLDKLFENIVDDE